MAQAASDETGQPDDRLAPTFRIHEHESDAMESSVIVRADTMRKQPNNMAVMVKKGWW